MPPDSPPSSSGAAPPGVSPAANAAPRSKRTLFWVFTTYFGEGLPWSFLHQMGTEYLTAIGASKTQIGSTSLLHLAVTFKFLWGPIVDLFGKKRTWMWAMQLVLGAGMLVVAAVVPSGSLGVFWALLGVLAILHATHDIACDGYYLLALDQRERALFSGVRVAAFRAAMIAGSSGLVVLAGKTNWVMGFGAAGVLMTLIGLVNLAVTPRVAEPQPDTTVTAGSSRGKRYAAPYVSFLTQPHAKMVLAFMFLYKLGDIMMFAMSKPLLRDIGIDTAQRGVLNGFGTGAFIVGSLAGGAFIARKGLERCLIPMTFIQNLAIPLYIMMAVIRPSFSGVLPIVMIEQLAAGIGAAAHVVFLMQRCRAAFSATHYAFATAVVSLGSTISGFISGPINEAVGHPWFFTIAFIASWPSLALVFYVPRTPIESAKPVAAA
jgi:MFS transporter, PAT family, beta-lactamase induction signal transducer AmpG